MYNIFKKRKTWKRCLKLRKIMAFESGHEKHTYKILHWIVKGLLLSYKTRELYARNKHVLSAKVCNVRTLSSWREPIRHIFLKHTCQKWCFSLTYLLNDFISIVWYSNQSDLILTNPLATIPIQQNVEHWNTYWTIV